MNEAVQEIWTQLGAERDETARGFHELTEERQLEGEGFLKATAGLVRWLRCGFAPGHRRPSAMFWEVLLSRGRAACVALLDRYVVEQADPREGLALWRSLAPALRLARNRGYVNWDLDSWRPGGGDDAKLRLVARVPQDVDERLRALRFATGRTLSDIVSDALAEHADRFEKENGPLPKREAAQEVAS